MTLDTPSPSRELADEATPLVQHHNLHSNAATAGHDASSILSSQLSTDELALADSAIGERLAYQDYMTIDWLHDLVKDAYRYRNLETQKGLRGLAAAAWDKYQGWIAAGLVGIFTAFVAFFVDNAESWLGDLKIGHCRRNPFVGREACCFPREQACDDWSRWAPVSSNAAFVVYAAAAVGLALAAGLVTKLTRTEVPAFASSDAHHHHHHHHHGGGHHSHLPRDEQQRGPPEKRVLYMAAGSGIPEIKLVLSGFVFPGLLSFRVLCVKAVGASLAVASGLVMGKEGPFVHIATSAGFIVSRLFPQYRQNGRKLREMLSVSCSSALAVAFGSPVGGVLFVYEEMSSQFPRKVLWRAFLCSLVSAIVLKSLNPNRTGKLVLLETNYGVKYKPKNYVYFILLGVAGGLFGAIFCKASLIWTKKIRNFVNKYPLVEVGLVALLTSLLQYPNPITREPSLLMIKSLLSDCAHNEESWICQQEKLNDKSTYYKWLAYGSAVKVLLTVLTTGSRIPSGLIVPALGAGAIFGRLVGQIVHDTSPGIFAMVGASAFLAGVSRMTVSLTVIMFELTGEVEFIPPFMIAILTAKVIVDALHEEGVNDHTVLGEFLEHEHASRIARSMGGVARDLVPPFQSMQDMTLAIAGAGTGAECKVLRQVLAQKLARMRRHGWRDAGLVLVDDRGLLHGFIAEAELDYVVRDKAALGGGEANDAGSSEPLDLLSGPVAAFVDRSPLTVTATTPLEMVVELVYQLGLRHLVVTEEDTSKVIGVILKQRLVMYLESARHH